MIVATSRPKKWKIGAKLIMFYQKTEFSHVLIIDGDLVYQASRGMVNCMHIDVFKKDNEIIDTYVVCPDTVDMEFVKKQLGKKYSISQIFLLPILRLFHAKSKGNGDSKFICSEFVGKALKLEWVGDFTTPKEIDNYLKSKLI